MKLKQKKQEELLMQISTRNFGTMPGGEKITLYALTNNNGMKAEIMNYGGVIVSLTAPDRDGKMGDVVLGYDCLEDYLDRSPYFGAIVGRHANRLEGARFTLNGITYELNKNEGNNQLHGGIKNFSHSVWDARILSDGESSSLELSLFSPDGEENYPGNLEVRVIYRLTDENALEIEYYGASDKDTILNMTNHAYFNLSGHGSGTILDHELMLNAHFYTPINSGCIPTGEIRSVKNTPFDFTSPKRIGDGLAAYADDEQIKNGFGYDHNFVLNISGDMAEEFGQVYDPGSGRFMRVFTTMPGVQFYTGNHLKSAGRGKGGALYDARCGLCLETQYFPNSMKYRYFPSPVLRAGQTYHQKTIYQFAVR